MSDSLLTWLRSTYTNCISSYCTEGGCQLRLDSLPSTSVAVIDANKYKHCKRFQGRICDFFVFHQESDLIIAVVELKSGLIHAGEALDQLANGAGVASEIAAGHHVGSFIPILLHGRGVSTNTKKALDKRRVSFRRKKYHVIRRRCGTQLGQILGEYKGPH